MISANLNERAKTVHQNVRAAKDHQRQAIMRTVKDSSVLKITPKVPERLRTFFVFAAYRERTLNLSRQTPLDAGRGDAGEQSIIRLPFEMFCLKRNLQKKTVGQHWRNRFYEEKA